MAKAGDRGEDAESLVERFGSPLYVYDANVLKNRSRELVKAFKGMQVHYAVKANANPALLKLIKAEGLGAEAVSPGEILAARRAGFRKTDISFTGPSLTESELRYAAAHAGRVHLDSITQLERWGKLGLGKAVSLRLNLGIGAGHHKHVRTGGDGSKFGVMPSDIARAIEIAGKYNLSITGLQQHIGSHIPDGSDYIEGARLLLTTAAHFPDVRHIDFGGGIGVPYAPGEQRVDLVWIGREVRALARMFEKGRGVPITFALEPGRYVVAEAGALLVSVTDIKKTGKHTFVGVNSGFNHLIRPALYNSYHCIRNLSRPRGKKEAISVAGNVCESGDVFAWDREAAMPELDDVLVVENVGAYGISMASTYNLRPLPREILVKDGRAKEVTFDRSPFLVQP